MGWTQQSATGYIKLCRGMYCSDDMLQSKLVFGTENGICIFNLLQIHQSAEPRDSTVVKSLHSGVTWQPWGLQFNTQELQQHKSEWVKQEKQKNHHQMKTEINN